MFDTDNRDFSECLKFFVVDSFQVRELHHISKGSSGWIRLDFDDGGEIISYTLDVFKGSKTKAVFAYKRTTLINRYSEKLKYKPIVTLDIGEPFSSVALAKVANGVVELRFISSDSRNVYSYTLDFKNQSVSKSIKHYSEFGITKFCCLYGICNNNSINMNINLMQNTRFSTSSE